MNARARAAALFPVWALVGAAGLASSLAVSGVLAAQTGCLARGLADLVAVWGMTGLGLAISTLLVVGAVPRYRTLPPTLGATAAFALSVYALLAYLTQSPTCP